MAKAFCIICSRTFKDEAGLSLHNAAKHNAGIFKEKKNNLAGFYLGIGLFIFIGIYFLFSQNFSTSNGSAVSNLGSSDLQKITIGMRNYNYYPNTIKVNANQLTEITLDSSVIGCYRSFSIPQFGVNKYSQNPGDKIIFTPIKKGTFQYRCSMGMAKGTFIVE